MEGYQVSAQCMALVRDNCLLPTKDAPELGYVRESTDKQYVPDVFFKVSQSFDEMKPFFAFCRFSFIFFFQSITSLSEDPLSIFFVYQLNFNCGQLETETKLPSRLRLSKKGKTFTSKRNSFSTRHQLGEQLGTDSEPSLKRFQLFFISHIYFT